jgi:hypothetical protein
VALERESGSSSGVVAEFLLFPPQRQVPPLQHSPFHEWSFADGTLWTQFYRTQNGYLLRFPDLADFQVSADGSLVTCTPAPNASEATTRHLYLNQVLPLALSKLGKLVFHASAVAFVAESGRGKSTLAASFALSGYRFLTDDGLVVEPGIDGYIAFPSHPSIRLWQDSEEALIPPGTKTEPPLEFTSKARFLAGDDIAFCDQPRPLRRVYFLGDGSTSTLCFHRMTASEAFIAWVKHSFLLDVEDKPLLARHFKQVSQHAAQPIYYRLDYPRRFDALARAKQAIVEHVQDRQAA